MLSSSKQPQLGTQEFNNLFRAETLEERVEFADPVITPEPATLALSAAGIAAVGFAAFLRRKRNK